VLANHDTLLIAMFDMHHKISPIPFSPCPDFTRRSQPQRFQSAVELRSTGEKEKKSQSKVPERPKTAA